MKKKMINRVSLEGVLYQHNLEERLTGATSKHPGTQYISGTIDVATDNAMKNIVQVHYTYVTPTTKNGKENASYKTLKDIIDGKVGVYTDPAVMEKAAKVRIDTVIGLNEFYSNRSGSEELVSVPRCEGGFIHFTSSINEDEKQRSTFEEDVVIVKVTPKDAVVDENDGTVITPEKDDIDARIFNFRNEILPVHFTVTSKGAMNYFEGLGASSKNPIFTKVRGQVIAQQLVRKIAEESAFGDASVREVRTTNKEYLITWAAMDPYPFGEEDTITMEDLVKAGQDRDLMLAGVKKRNDEYQASRNATTTNAAPASSVNTAPAQGEYKF